MKWIIILIITFYATKSLSCEKEITVKEVRKKMLPSLLTFQKKTYEGDARKIKIDCELYKQIKVGDHLFDPNAAPELDIRDSLFNSPVEQKTYKVLEM